MGLLDELLKSTRRKEDAIDIYNDMDGTNYRQRGFENTPSNHGWYRCVKCGKSFRKGDMDIDHIYPKSLGGGNERENLQCICKHCNRSKQADTTDTYADLACRKKELIQQDKEDRAFVSYAMKQYRKEQKEQQKIQSKKK